MLIPIKILTPAISIALLIFAGCSINTTKRETSALDKFERQATIIVGICAGGRSNEIKGELVAALRKDGGELSASYKEEVKGAFPGREKLSSSDLVKAIDRYHVCVQKERDRIEREKLKSERRERENEVVLTAEAQEIWRHNLEQLSELEVQTKNCLENVSRCLDSLLAIPVRFNRQRNHPQGYTFLAHYDFEYLNRNRFSVDCTVRIMSGIKIKSAKTGYFSMSTEHAVVLRRWWKSEGGVISG